MTLEVFSNLNDSMKLNEKREQTRPITCEVGTKGGVFLFTDLWLAKHGLRSKFHVTVKIRLWLGSPSLNKPIKLGCSFQIHATASDIFIVLCSFLIYIFPCLPLRDVKKNRVSL